MLVVTPEDYIGRLVVLRPGYGWGWRRADNEDVRIAFEPIIQLTSQVVLPATKEALPLAEASVLTFKKL